MVASKERITDLKFAPSYANWVRYSLGINAVPAEWKLRDGELKFLPESWKEYQDIPVSEEQHRQWIKSGAFSTGIAGILGKVFHRPDKLGWYLTEVDMDNALAIEENIRWKGDKSLSDFAKKGLVTQHTAKLDSSAKYYVYSKRSLKNKNPNPEESRDDLNNPFWEIHCEGRMAIMPGSKHKKGDPVIILGDQEPFTLQEETDVQMFEQFHNSICIKHGLRPYLNSSNSNDSNSRNGNYNGSTRDSTPLNDDIKLMIRNLKYDEKVVINHGARHATMLKIADSILLQHSEDIDISTLRDFFILINEHCCKPGPLPQAERDKIWDDAVAYIANVKTTQARRVFTVSEVVREKPGPNKTVKGTIVSISSIFKVAIRTEYRCRNCNTIHEGRGSRTKVNIYWIDEKNAPKKCVNCSETEFELDEESSIFDDAKIVTLQNTDLRTDLDETLEVILLGEYTKDIKAGEHVVITGSLYHGQSNLGKSKKTITLMTAKFVTYEGRQNYAITESDIKAFHKFARFPNIINRLISMLAPNVIGEEAYKLGLLRSIVGGLDGQRRGRIHTLSAGNKGLAKSLAMNEAVDSTPNARRITAKSASSTSALGMVDSTNDVKTLIYGPIPLSSGSLVGIDELQTWTHDNQGILLNVMEEGRFNLLKYARDKAITAETTILATVNPQDIDYENRVSISIQEINLLAPLLDRFDQIYVSLDEFDEQKDWEYSGQRLNHTRKRQPHNYNFLTKYLVHAKTIEPTLTPEAEIMLRRFWVDLRKQRLAGKRMLESIFRIAEATAKLRLEDSIDSYIALEVQTSIQVMQTRLGRYVKTIQDPRDAFIPLAEQIIEHTQAPILFDELTRQVCKEDLHVKSWIFGGVNNVLDIENNKRYRELRTRFIQHVERPESRILITSRKPLIIIWQTSKIGSTTDSTDSTDHPPSQKNAENDIQSIVKNDENQKEGRSVRSVRSVAPVKGPQYEYLQETNSYRCLGCKCIYLADTKDNREAHPCNTLNQEAAN